jgi:hypothetical protein
VIQSSIQIDAVMDHFRSIAQQMRGSADHSFNWVGPNYSVSDLTKEQAEARVARYGGTIKSNQEIQANYERIRDGR